MFFGYLRPIPADISAMPLLLSTHPFADATFGLWQIAEDEAFFRTDLPLSVSEESEFARHINPLRRLEWLAGRWLLHKLTDAPHRFPLAKDAFSKPFFPENQDLACSLSHSKGIVGALISTVHRSSFIVHRSIGCDIQVLTEKMPRIAHKFLHEAEQDFVKNRPYEENLDLLHLFWTAKESLYKAYGLKELDFRKNLFVGNIEWDGLNGTGIGTVEKGDFRLEFQLIFSKLILPEEGELITAVCGEK
ncbi:MAG: 4'-phosphopantetheinyl transferase superfamily protein [Saprospiraceae bacterium]|nr:4'-phosphopantetheinyl transferase superfamily protein [Saprospiraceae bacterium]